jgi:hypothetical protein
MKILTLFVPVFLISTYCFSQIVETEPPVPVETEPVTVIFDATKGSGGLAGYMGDVYAHTGVITQFSAGGSDWKYVKTGWGEKHPCNQADAHRAG